MKVLEFHADDLLDRELKGALSGDDRRALQEHLSRCASCRLERQLRSDFDRELGPRAESPDLHTLVTGALRAASAPPRAARIRRPEPKPAAAASGSLRWKRRFFFLCAATVMLGTGVAVAEPELPAHTWNIAREVFVDWFGGSPRAEGAPPQAQAKRTPVAALSAPPLRETLPQASDEAIEAEPSVAEPFPTATAAAPFPKAPPPPKALTATVEAPRAETRVEAPPSPTANLQPPLLVDSAPGLFERANIARRQGNAIEASALYRDLQARFPRSGEARLSLAIVARMQLDRRESAAALAGFEAYTATGDGALREEAMEGRALALERLGRASEEKRAWQDLLRAYPNSAYAAVARKRLGQDVP